MVHCLTHIGTVGLAGVQRTVPLVSTPVSPLALALLWSRTKGLEISTVPPPPDPEQNQVADSINLSTDLN